MTLSFQNSKPGSTDLPLRGHAQEPRHGCAVGTHFSDCPQTLAVRLRACVRCSPLSPTPSAGREPAVLGRREAGPPPPLSPGSAFSGSRARRSDPPAPFSPLMSLKCLAWVPASPAPARRRDRARANPAPPAPRRAGGPRGKDAPRARPGPRGRAPVCPLRSRGLPKMQIPGHTYQIAILACAFFVGTLGGQGPRL